ncbi:MAG: hypothetical protein U1F11_06195 [Steroidobacteraceae bacterium]
MASAISSDIGLPPASASTSAAIEAERRFFFWMAIVFVLVAFGGFTPSYWAPIASGRMHAPPVTHIHGLVLFSWTLFYLPQSAWVVAGRVPRHRAWGLAGISLFTLLLCSILALKVTMLRLDAANGFEEASLGDSRRSRLCRCR